MDLDPLRHERVQQAADKALRLIAAFERGDIPRDFEGNPRGIFIYRAARDFDVSSNEVGKELARRRWSRRPQPRHRPPARGQIQQAYLSGKYGEVPDICPECSREIRGATCPRCG